MTTMAGRLVAVAAVCAGVMGCGGGVDRQRFDRIYTTGKALQSEVSSSGSGPVRAESRERLKEFDAEIDAVRDHTIGIHEADALKAYAESADAYRYFLRFRTLETEEGTTQILLKGPNLEVATRYKLPVDTRSGTRSVSRAQAITILLQAAEQHLADGNRIAGRQ
jgi:hypothetical protein